jgi:hypothetical protein
MQVLSLKNKSNWIKLILAALLFGILTTWLILQNWGQQVIPVGRYIDKPIFTISIPLLLGLFLTFIFFVLFNYLQNRIDLPTVLLIAFFILFFFFLAPVGPNVLTFDHFADNPCCHDYDIGFFYSIFHIMSHGEKLYTEVLEIKDPVFFYLNTIFYSLLGQKGPMILELLLSITMVISIGVIGYRLKINLLGKAILLGIFIIIAFTSPAYVILHTYHQPICFFLVIICLTLSKRTRGNAILCGILFSIMIFSKLLFLLLFPAILVAVLLFDQLEQPITFNQIKKKTIYFLGGILAGFLAIIIIMLIRGEMSGYIDMNMLQIHYYQIKNDVLGFPKATTFQFLEFYLGSGFILFLTLVTEFCLFFSIKPLVSLSRREKQKTLLDIDSKFTYVCIFSLCSILGILGVTHFTHLWQHHLQPMSLAITMGILPLFVSPWIKKKPLITNLSILACVICVVVTSVPFTILRSTIGTYKPEISRTFNGQDYWSQNEEINVLLDSLHKTKNRNLNYVTLQMNYPGFISTILPDYMKFNCVYLSQGPIANSFTQFNSCINSKKIDVIFKMSIDYTDNMPDLEQGISDALKNFHVVMQYGGYDVYVRNN